MQALNESTMTDIIFGSLPVEICMLAIGNNALSFIRLESS
jgi:hypothetical protein